jgi:hypothetical protein
MILPDLIFPNLFPDLIFFGLIFVLGLFGTWTRSFRTKTFLGLGYRSLDLHTECFLDFDKLNLLICIVFRFRLKLIYTTAPAALKMTLNLKAITSSFKLDP